MRAKSIIEKITQPQADYLSDKAALSREANRELACLVGMKGWLYAQRVANEIQREFDCRPTDPNWHVFTTVQYALNQLFERVRVRAKSAESALSQGSILAEIKENYDSTSRRDTSGRPGGASSRKRRRTG